MRERDHNTLLKQEQRKLREGDMVKVAQRRKRLELKRKIDIIEKEKQDDALKIDIRQREQILIDTRYENTVRCNFEKIKFIEEVQTWAHTGYSTTKNARRKVNMSASPNIEKYAGLIQMKGLPQEKKEEP